MIVKQITIDNKERKTLYVYSFNDKTITYSSVIGNEIIQNKITEEYVIEKDNIMLSFSGLGFNVNEQVNYAIFIHKSML